MDTISSLEDITREIQERMGLDASIRSNPSRMSTNDEELVYL